MCGLFGAIGADINPHIIRALAIANRDRGTHSLGFFDSDGSIEKAAGDPFDVLPCVADYIDKPGRWFLAGHTRHATRGATTDDNAHPFRYGRIIGSHNGQVSAPEKYSVDSEYLFDRLNTEKDYQTALGKISGYWSLTWFDGEHLYMQAYDNTITLGAVGAVIYYASDPKHLLAACTPEETLTLRDGQTIRFARGGGPSEWLPPLKNDEDWFGGKWWDTPAKPAKPAKPKRRGLDRYVTDRLARDAGYHDLAHFMVEEGYLSKQKAIDALESLLFSF